MRLFRKNKKSSSQKGKISPEKELWLQMKNDKQYCSLMDENAKLHDEIEADYSVLNTLGVVDGPEVDAFIKKCTRAMSTVELLMPMWKKYNQPLPTLCIPAKRLAMIHEKRGDYEAAAAVCMHALKMGWTDDGTSGAMRGRLARMVKKGKLEITPELKEFLTVQQ